jgi:hypothetical protein
MLKIVVVFILLAHGIGHVMGFLESWANLPVGFLNRPSIFSEALTFDNGVGRAFGILWLIAMLGFVGAALGLVGGHSGWRDLAIIAAVVSLVVIIPWWNTVTPGARFGAVLTDILILAALLLPWHEQVLNALR